MYRCGGGKPACCSGPRWAGRAHIRASAPPEWLVTQFLPRGDHNIGALEAVAVIVGLATFAVDLSHTDVLVFIDNQGVLHGFLNAMSRNPETNFMAGELWLRAAAVDMRLFCWRVESKANIADGPTRNYFELVDRIGCVCTQPVWPDVLRDLWESPGGVSEW